MKDLFNKYKREVIVGIVVSLITAAIIKFGDWLVAIVPVIGITVFETASNILYSLAATHNDNLLLRIILYSCLSLIAGLLAKTTFDGLRLYKAALNIEKESKNLSPEKLDEISEEASKELKEKAQKESRTNIKELVKKGKSVGKNAIFTIALFVFLYGFISFFIFAPMDLSNQFQQDIVKIAPYVEEKEIIQFKSDWVCVRSKAEYDEIYEKINAIKEKHNLP